MKEIIKNLKSDKILYRFFYIDFIFILISFLYALLEYRSLPPFIPIFNQLPWGDSRLSQTPGIFFPLIVVLIIFIVNNFIAGLIYSNTPLVARMLSVTNFLISLLGLLFIFRTIEIVL